MDSSKLKVIAITSMVSIAALWIGMNAATAQKETIVWITGISTLVICTILGQRIWLLLPLMGALNLKLQFLPGEPNTYLIAQLLFIGFSVILFLTRKLNYTLRVGELGFWAILLSLCVAQVYLRNPAGLNVFGSSTVGARPYAIFGVSLVCGMILLGLTVRSEDLKWILRLSVIGWIVNFGLFLIGSLIPSIGYYYGAAGSWRQIQETESSMQRATRISFLGRAGENLATFVAAHVSPISSILKPQWAVLILLSIAFAGMSGFRNDVGAVGLTYILALAYHGGWNHLLTATLMLAMGLTLLAIVNLATPLPPNIQRSLSFLPGTWEEDIRRDAKNSTEWRYEIWEEVMFTDRWIHNKWLGDGLGFSARELRLQQQLEDMRLSGINTMGTSGFDMHRESILANGDYHSGPIQTIRTIGYIGLVVLLFALIRLAVHAHRLIKLARGTPYRTVCLLIGIPLIIYPFFFTFIYGEFKIAAATYLTGMGMVALIRNSLPRATAPAGTDEPAAP